MTLETLQIFTSIKHLKAGIENTVKIVAFNTAHM